MSGLRREYFEDWSKLISKYQAICKRLIIEHYKRKRWGGGGDMRPDKGQNMENPEDIKPVLQRERIGISNYRKHSWIQKA